MAGAGEPTSWQQPIERCWLLVIIKSRFCLCVVCVCVPACVCARVVCVKCVYVWLGCRSERFDFVILARTEPSNKRTASTAEEKQRSSTHREARRDSNDIANGFSHNLVAIHTI